MTYIFGIFTSNKCNFSRSMATPSVNSHPSIQDIFILWQHSFLSNI